MPTKRKTAHRPKTPQDVIRYARIRGFTDAAKGRVTQGTAGSGTGSMAAMHARFQMGAPVNRGDGLPDWAYKQGVECYFDMRECVRIEMVSEDGTPMVNVSTLVENFFLGTEMTAGDVAQGAGEAAIDEFVPGGSAAMPEWGSDALQIVGAGLDVAVALLD